MNSADRFRKFAAECKAMARIANSLEKKHQWDVTAERWLRCAEMTDKLDVAISQKRMAKRHGRSGYGISSPADPQTV